MSGGGRVFRPEKDENAGIIPGRRKQWNSFPRTA